MTPLTPMSIGGCVAPAGLPANATPATTLNHALVVALATLGLLSPAVTPSDIRVCRIVPSPGPCPPARTWQLFGRRLVRSRNLVPLVSIKLGTEKRRDHSEGGTPGQGQIRHDFA